MDGNIKYGYKYIDFVTQRVLGLAKAQRIVPYRFARRRRWRRYCSAVRTSPWSTWDAASIRAALTRVIATKLRHGRPNADSDLLQTNRISPNTDGIWTGKRLTKTFHAHVSPLTIVDAISE